MKINRFWPALMRIIRTRDKAFVAALLSALILSLAAPALIYISTRHGIGLRDDSFTYLASASSLSSGDGYGRFSGDGTFSPTTNFPPLYSATLALLHWIGLSVQASARLVNGLSFGTTVLLVSIIAYLVSGSFGASALGGLLTISSPALLETETWAQSEGLYLALSLAALVLVGSICGNSYSRRNLIMAAALLAGCTMTRYVGLTLVAASGLGMLLWGQVSLRERVKRAGALVLLSILPLLLFIIRNWLVAGSLTNRPAPYVHPVGLEAFHDMDVSILGWFTVHPSRIAVPIPGLVSVVLVLLLVGAIPWIVRPNRSPEQNQYRHALASLTGMYGLAYILFIVISKSFFDRLIPFDTRMMSVVFPPAALGALYIAWDRFLPRSRGLFALGATLLILGAWFGAQTGWHVLQKNSTEGQGFSSNAWKASPVMAYVRSLPDETPIYSNNLPAIYFVGRRLATFIPAEFNPSSLTQREDYKQNLEAMRRHLRAKHGVIAIVGPSPRDRIPPKQLAEITLGMVMVKEFSDGLIYAPNQP